MKLSRNFLRSYTRARTEDDEAENTKNVEMRTKLFHLEQEQSKEQVRVTVGGQVFQASRATLTEGDAAHSMLGALYSGRWEHAMTSAGASNSKVSSEGGVSIDRSPVLFTYVLQWLRSGSAECLPDSADLRRGLLREAEYYILPGLVDILKGWRQRSLSLSAESKSGDTASREHHTRETLRSARQRQSFQ